jgi:hypothetical protein
VKYSIAFAIGYLTTAISLPFARPDLDSQCQEFQNYGLEVSVGLLSLILPFA